MVGELHASSEWLLDRPGAGLSHDVYGWIANPISDSVESTSVMFWVPTRLVVLVKQLVEALAYLLPLRHEESREDGIGLDRTPELKVTSPTILGRSPRK